MLRAFELRSGDGGTLAGRRALVTGGNRGIGAGVVETFVREGARVAINYWEDEEAAQRLVSRLGVEATSAFYGDVRVEQDVSRMFERAVRFLGGVDILVNNAGCESTCSVIDLPLEEWNRVLETNLTGAFLCSREAARFMRDQGRGGVILNNSSIHESIPRLGLAHYCVSKAALGMLTRSLALEWAEFGIRVVAVAPGAVETELNQSEIESFGREKFEQWIPAGTLGRIDQIAAAFLYLASDAAAYVTGVTLPVDGGYSLTTIRYDPRSKGDK